MEANQLMIGNLLLKDNEIIEVDSIYTASDGLHDINGYYIKNYEPIPLTEEWLLRFGFEEIIGNVENSKCFRHPKCSLIVYFDGTRLSVNFWQGNEKKHVHQLQNLYFALTRTHLTLK